MTRDATQAKAIAAVDRLASSLRDRMYDMAARDIECDDLLAALESEAGSGVAAVVRPVAQLFVAETHRLRDRAGVVTDGVLKPREGQLFRLHLAVFDYYAQRDASKELQLARAEVSDLEQQQQQVVAKLEEAVTNADIDEVLRLRTESEVLVPRRLDRAKVRALELEVNQAAAVAAAPAEYLTKANAQAEAAHEGVLAAQAALDAAITAEQTAAWRFQMADAVNQQRQAQVEASVSQRDSLRAQAQSSDQGRMRKLAGLAVG